MLRLRSMSLMAVLAVPLLAGPVGAQGTSPLTLGEADNGQTLKLTVGEEVTVVLESTPSRSRYVVTGPAGKTPVVYLGESYTPSAPGQLSQGGQQSFRFRATAPGKTSLRLSLLNRRSVPLKSLRYFVTVAPALQGAARPGSGTPGRPTPPTAPGARGPQVRPRQLTLADVGKSVDVAVGAGLSLSLAGGERYGVPTLSGPELQRFGPQAGSTSTSGARLFAYHALASGQVTITVPVLDASGQTLRSLLFTVNVR